MMRKIGPAVIVTMMTLAGCQTAPLPPGVAVATDAANYKLGAGDKVRVTTFNEPNLSGEFVISGTGAVAMPLAGDIPARGKSPDELAQAIAERLSSGGFVRTPQVTAEVTEYRPYYILGEVQKSGQYPFTIGLTVAKAVATAGGYTYRADKRRVFLTHEGGNVEQELPMTASTPIGPGDTVRIGERFF